MRTPPRRIKPHHLVIAIGVFMGVFTLVSGVLPQITDWHGEKTPAREVFEGIPGPLQIAFYTVIPAMLVWGAFAFGDRVKNWERGAPIGGAPHPRTPSGAWPTSVRACTCAPCCATRPPA